MEIMREVLYTKHIPSLQEGSDAILISVAWIYSVTRPMSGT